LKYVKSSFFFLLNVGDLSLAYTSSIVEIPPTTDMTLT
jgi:hypothetical protein